MKLWLKIYLFSFVLLIITLNSAGFILVQKLHNDSIKKEVEDAVTQEKFIASQLKNNSILYGSQYKEEGNERAALITDLVDKYKKFTEAKDGRFEILNISNEVLYSDSHFKKSEKLDELDSLVWGKTNYVIRTIEDKQYIYSAGIQSVMNMPVKVHYVKEISDVYSDKVNNYTFFLKLDFIICVLFAVFMFFISRLITRPIKTLADSTQKIADGNYSERVTISSKDEFKELADNFNSMAETVEDKINELEFSNAAKETFINNFTHELKTPLTSIIGYANLINTSKYDEKLFYEASSYIYKEGKRLESMAFKMMDFIYAKEGAVELKKEDVMDIVKEVETTLEIKFKDKGMNLVTEGESIDLNLDRELMIILLSNLIDNAIKSSEKGTDVFVKVKKVGDKAVISIEDEGRGIPKEHLNKIFDPFYVVDKSRSRKNNGAGIGLSICKRITESLNGRIEIESIENKGTKVRLTFDMYK